MSAETVVKEAVQSVPKAVAGGVVDMGSGMMLAIKTVESHPQAVIDVLAPATKELFEGEMVTHIENLFKKARGVEADKLHYFQEILISSTNLWHYFGRLKSNPQVVVVVVARGDVNMGMFLVKAREITQSAVI